MRTGTVKLSIYVRNLLLYFLVTILACASLCKKKPVDNYPEPVNVSNNSGRSENPSIAVDSKGTLHLVWNDDTPGNEEIFYAMKPVGDSWSEPVQVTYNMGASRFPCIVIDKNDKIHLVWQQVVYQEQTSYWEIFYTWRFAGDTWATPETISIHGVSTGPKLAVDDYCGLHLFWREAFTPDNGFNYYAYKPLSDTWQDYHSIPFGDKQYPWYYEIKVDKSQGIYIVLSMHGEVYLIEKNPSGNWTDRIRISHTPIDWPASEYPDFTIGDDNTLHLVWAEADTTLEGVVYVKRPPQGEWSSPISPYKNDYDWSLPSAKIEIGKSGKIYVVWGDVRTGLGYGIKEGEVWGPSKIIAKTGGPGRMVLDQQEMIHLTWQDDPEGTTTDNADIYYIEFKP